jgi:hypothetical protein
VLSSTASPRASSTASRACASPRASLRGPAARLSVCEAVFVADAADDGLEAFDKLPPCGRLGEGVFGEHVEGPPEFVEERAAEHGEHRAHEHLAQVGGREGALRRAAYDALRPRAALVVDGPRGDDGEVG